MERTNRDNVIDSKLFNKPLTIFNFIFNDKQSAQQRAETQRPLFN